MCVSVTHCLKNITMDGLHIIQKEERKNLALVFPDGSILFLNAFVHPNIREQTFSGGWLKQHTEVIDGHVDELSAGKTSICPQTSQTCCQFGWTSLKSLKLTYRLPSSWPPAQVELWGETENFKCKRVAETLHFLCVAVDQVPAVLNLWFPLWHHKRRAL